MFYKICYFSHSVSGYQESLSPHGIAIIGKNKVSLDLIGRGPGDVFFRAVTDFTFPSLLSRLSQSIPIRKKWGIGESKRLK